MNNKRLQEQITIIGADYTQLFTIFDQSKALHEYCLQLFKNTEDRDIQLLRYFRNPCLEVIKEAISQNALNMMYVRNQTEELQLLCIEGRVEALKHIHNPTEKVLKEFIKRSYLAVYYLKPHHSKELWEFAMIQHPCITIRHIPKQTEKFNLIAVTHNSNALKYIANPSSKVKWQALKSTTNAFCFEDIHNPTKDMKIYAIQMDPDNLAKLKKQTFEFILLALKHHPKMNRKLIDYSVLTHDQIEYIRLL